MSLLTGDYLVAAFVTGRKRADLHPAASDARRPATLAVPLAAVAIGSAAFGVLQIDRLSFTPGTHSDADKTVGGEAGKGEHDDDQAARAP